MIGGKEIPEHATTLKRVKSEIERRVGGDTALRCPRSRSVGGTNHQNCEALHLAAPNAAGTAESAVPTIGVVQDRL